MAAFTPHDASAERGWPARVLPFNPTLRLTAGLANTYRAVGAKQSLPRHETTADGRLVLTPETPLLAHRYRFMHVLVESDLSQMICAVDTYRHCEPTAEGRRQPLVAIKVVTDIVDGDKPSHEEFLENLATAAQSLQKTVPAALDFIAGKPLDAVFG